MCCLWESISFFSFFLSVLSIPNYLHKYVQCEWKSFLWISLWNFQCQLCLTCAAPCVYSTKKKTASNKVIKTVVLPKWPWHTCIHITPFMLLLIVIGILPCLLAARGNCSVWEGDCAAGRPGEVDGTGLLRMDPRSEGRAPETRRAPGAGHQRQAGGPAPLPGEHPDQWTQLQGCPEGEGTARWAPLESSVFSFSLYFF